MGIYIKGMGMPINCNCCVFSRLSPTGESLKCCIDYSTVPWDEKPFDCPLIPVPDHGRLIDADKLKQELQTAGIVGTYGTQVLLKIDNAPTIIPADHFADVGNMADKEAGE